MKILVLRRPRRNKVEHKNTFPRREEICDYTRDSKIYRSFLNDLFFELSPLVNQKNDWNAVSVDLYIAPRIRHSADFDDI